eukprot:m51a1_g2037 hypothetical protein (314) ;mRNA; r:1342116-1343640
MGDQRELDPVLAPCGADDLPQTRRLRSTPPVAALLARYALGEQWGVRGRVVASSVSAVSCVALAGECEPDVRGTTAQNTEFALSGLWMLFGAVSVAKAVALARVLSRGVEPPAVDPRRDEVVRDRNSALIGVLMGYTFLVVLICICSLKRYMVAELVVLGLTVLLGFVPAALARPEAYCAYGCWAACQTMYSVWMITTLFSPCSDLGKVLAFGEGVERLLSAVACGTLARMSFKLASIAETVMPARPAAEAASAVPDLAPIVWLPQVQFTPEGPVLSPGPQSEGKSEKTEPLNNDDPVVDETTPLNAARQLNH